MELWLCKTWLGHSPFLPGFLMTNSPWTVSILHPTTRPWPRAVGRQWDGSGHQAPDPSRCPLQSQGSAGDAEMGSAKFLCAFSMVLFIQQRQGP